MEKTVFKKALRQFAASLGDRITTPDHQWSIKGFVDVFRNVYTISADTKVVSKILEIHLFPELLTFADKHGFHIVLADHQNYYPDLSFVAQRDSRIKFAVDLKTTYRLPEHPKFCNGFTLGSHGSYFKERDKRKNIQFAYNEYAGHFCLVAIYSRTSQAGANETVVRRVEQLESIVSVIRDIQFFACEKWEIASDMQGSGNTANIGSIVCIDDILGGNGVFRNLGEQWFDDYWMNYNEITIIKDGKPTKIRRLRDFLEYKGESTDKLSVVRRPTKAGKTDG